MNLTLILFSVDSHQHEHEQPIPSWASMERARYALLVVSSERFLVQRSQNAHQTPALAVAMVSSELCLECRCLRVKAAPPCAGQQFAVRLSPAPPAGNTGGLFIEFRLNSVHSLHMLQDDMMT